MSSRYRRVARSQSTPDDFLVRHRHKVPLVEGPLNGTLWPSQRWNRERYIHPFFLLLKHLMVHTIATPEAVHRGSFTTRHRQLVVGKEHMPSDVSLRPRGKGSRGTSNEGTFEALHQPIVQYWRWDPSSAAWQAFTRDILPFATTPVSFTRLTKAMHPSLYRRRCDCGLTLPLGLGYN